MPQISKQNKGVTAIVGIKQDTTNIYGILGRLEVKLDTLDSKLDRILLRPDDTHRIITEL